MENKKIILIGLDGGETIEVTEKEKDVLVDFDIVWYNWNQHTSTGRWEFFSAAKESIENILKAERK